MANQNNKNINSEERLRNTKIVTGKLIIHHPHLFKPWSFSENTPARYSVIGVIPKTSEDIIQDIKAAIEAAKHNGKHLFGGSIPNDAEIQLPLNDGDAAHVTDIMYRGSYYLTFSTPYRPGVVDEKMKTVYFRDVLDGSYARISAEFQPYCVKGKNGISARLLNVQLFNDRLDISSLMPSPMDDFS